MSSDDELPEALPRWEIPSDWKWVSIADVGKVITGNTPPTKDESNYGNFIPFVKPPALTDKGIRSTSEGLSEAGVRSSRTLPAGAVLVSCIGGLGKTGIAKVPMAFNQQINAIVFDQRVVPEFGFYYAQTLKPWLHGVASATTLPIVNKGKFQRAPFPLAPIDQQKRIVAEIEKQFSRLDEAVANLKRVKANLKRYKAAVLKAAVEGHLVETEAELARYEGRSYETGEQLLQRILETRRSQWKGKGKYKEPATPDTTDLPELPEGWAWATYAQIGEVTTGFTPPTADPENFGGGIPFFKPTDLDAGESVVLAREHLSEKGVAKGRLLPAGSVLVTCIGATIGKTGLARVHCATNQQINAVTPDGNLVNSKFVYAWTVSPSGYKQILDNSSATTLPILNKSKFAALGIPLPPLVDQHRIVAEVDRRLSLLRETEAQVVTNIQRAERMRQALLSSVFSGKLVTRIREQCA